MKTKVLAAASLAAVMSLGVAVSASWATTLVLGSGTIGATGTLTAGPSPKPAAFPVDYTFDLTAQTYLTAIFSDIKASPSVSGVLDLFSGTPGSGTLLESVAITGVPGAFGTTPDLVTAGDYYIQLTGTPTTKFAYTVQAATTAVPEPATWMMMVGGIGLMGAGLRMRRRGASVTFA